MRKNATESGQLNAILVRRGDCLFWRWRHTLNDENVYMLLGEQNRHGRHTARVHKNEIKFTINIVKEAKKTL